MAVGKFQARMIMKTMKSMKSIGKKLSFILILCLTLVNCTPKQKSDYGLDLSQTLRINIAAEPPSLDWDKAIDTTSSLILFNLMEGLVNYDFTTPQFKLVPGLAAEWREEQSGKIWFFKIRSGVKWSDGQDFVAQQILDGWERLLNPSTAAQYAYFLFGIKNARSYNEGKIKDFSQVGVSITEKGEIRVELNSPTAYFPYLMVHHSTYPIRKDLIAQWGDKWTDPEHMTTLGPFRLKIWDHDKAVVMERNETYYGEKAKVKNVVAYMISELSTAINLFNVGKIDFQGQMPSTEIAQLRKRPEFRETSTLSIYYLGFNTEKAPFDNREVRKALSYAIDRNEITQILGGGEVPLTSWVPPGLLGYDPGIGINFNVQTARDLLDKAGFKDRSKLPKIQFGFNTNEDHKRIAENIQAQLKRNLKIDIELKNEEWKMYLKSLQTNPPALFRIGWSADYPDPDNFLNLMTSYSENNNTRWKNKKFDELVNQGVGLSSPEERKKVYTQAQKMLTEEEVPVIPIFVSVAHALISNRVQNFPYNSLQLYPFKNVVLK